MNIVRATLITAALAALLASGGCAPVEKDASAPLESSAVRDTDGITTDQSGGDEKSAKAYLRELGEKFDHLDNVSVTFGQTPNGEQAVAYYERGVIVIDSEHSVSIQTILDHEIWHIIDYRDDGRLDWGENLPPSDWAAYSAK